MRKKYFIFFAWLPVLFLASGCSGPAGAARKAAASITEEELQLQLDFLASDEFGGRNAPSPELKITSRYLATQVELFGLTPVMPDGSFYQELPLVLSSVDEARSHMRLRTGGTIRDFTFPEDFGIPGRSFENRKISGEILFAGYGFSGPDQDWDDLKGLDIPGKIVVILDAEVPGGPILKVPGNRRGLRTRTRMIGSRGAAAVLSVVSREREASFAAGGHTFDDAPRGRPASELTAGWISSTGAAWLNAEIRPETAAALIGVPQSELSEMFATLERGERVPGRQVSGRSLDITVETRNRRDVSHNVVAMVAGRDESLRDQYVLLGAHHDHLGAREGKIFNGADDNGSGTVAMLEIAQALLIHPPRRSVILVWHTAEEKGLWGARYFVEHSPVPVENMSAELNMDMLGRNDPDSLYLVGSIQLSSELDAAIHAANERGIGFRLDPTYQDPGHPDNFFFRSDHYPYIQYGVPAVWFFCGTTPDYHRETDTVDRVDYNKIVRAARLVYLTALEIGDKPDLLKLDLHPGINVRGAHNLKIEWRRP